MVLLLAHVIYDAKEKHCKTFTAICLFCFFIICGGMIFTNINLSNPFTSTVEYTLIAVVFAGIIQEVTINNKGKLPNLFTQKWLILTGKISYGLYIYHWIILRVLYGKLMEWFKKNQDFGEHLNQFVALALCLLISYVVSLLSYFYFEAFFLKFKRK